MTIPGGRPLATPAVVDGHVFVGGGFGSHEFYAFDAAIGNLRWVYRTADDGPTAAVFGDGRIVFNTESCELEVITPDGKPVWKKWLGDPLMSMPAIADGMVYMAYPNSRDDGKYYIAAFNLASGKQMWKSPIAGEIITAPVIEGQRVYLATVDGSLVSFDRRDGTQPVPGSVLDGWRLHHPQHRLRGGHQRRVPWPGAVHGRPRHHRSGERLLRAAQRHLGRQRHP